MEGSVTIKVIIDKSELDRLQAIEKQHMNCGKNTLVKEGRGCDSILQEEINETECSDTPSASIPKVTLNQTENAIEREEPPLTNEVIIDYIRKRFKHRAKVFLQHIQPFRHELSWNHWGIVKLYGKVIQGSSIFELVALLFYENRFKDVAGKAQFVTFLENNNLTKFVANKALLKTEEKLTQSEDSEKTEEWFFLGLLD